MDGNDKATKRRYWSTENHVASALAVDFVPDSLERANRFGSRNRWELAQTATSTNSSSIEGGIGSP
jgi:hypothetical protein